MDEDEKKESASSIKEVEIRSNSGLPEDLDMNSLEKAFKFAAVSSIVLVCGLFELNLILSADLFTVQVVIFIILVPLPLFFTSTIFGKEGLTAWVTIGIIWVFAAIATVVFLPLWESREALAQVFRGIVKV